MNQILHCDWLPERAKWSDTACSGLSILFLQKSIREVQLSVSMVFSILLTTPFLWQNIFCDGIKIFYDFCVGMELENVCFQKISRPPPRRELEIPEGSGADRSRKFLWGGEFKD